MNNYNILYPIKKLLLLTVLITISTATVLGQGEQKRNPTDFLPKGFVVFEKINGDLNKDGIEDYVFIIKLGFR